MNEVELIAILRENRFLRTREECVAFDNALAALPIDLDARFLPELFLIFEDSSEHQEVMWGLLHFIEDFDDKLMTDTLLDMTPKILLHASDWCETMHCRVQNSEECRKYYLEKLQQLSQMERNNIKEFLEKVFENFGDITLERLFLTKARVLDTIKYIETLENR